MAVRLEARWKLGRLLAEIERMKATESGKLKGKGRHMMCRPFPPISPRSISTATPPSAHSGWDAPGGRAPPRLRAVATTMRDCRTAPSVVMTTSGDGPG